MVSLKITFSQHRVQQELYNKSGDLIPFLEPVPSSLSDVKIDLQNILEIHATPITFNASVSDHSSSLPLYLAQQPLPMNTVNTSN